MADESALPALLALPAPEDASAKITLDVATGEPVTLDAMGPVVVNTDGTLSRITNWDRMEEQERDVVKRRICKRNVERLRGFAASGDLKDSLVSALAAGSEQTTQASAEPPSTESTESRSV